MSSELIYVNKRLSLSTYSKHDVCTDGTYFLDRVAKLSARKFVPQAFNGSKVRGWNALHLSEVNKVPTLLLGSSEDDKSVPGKLFSYGWFWRREDFEVCEMCTKVSTVKSFDIQGMPPIRQKQVDSACPKKKRHRVPFYHSLPHLIGFCQLTSGQHRCQRNVIHPNVSG